MLLWAFVVVMNLGVFANEEPEMDFDVLIGLWCGGW